MKIAQRDVRVHMQVVHVDGGGFSVIDPGAQKRVGELAAELADGVPSLCAVRHPEVAGGRGIALQRPFESIGKRTGNGCEETKVRFR